MGDEPTKKRVRGLRGLGEWCARRFVVVILAWLAALGVLHGLQNTVGGTYSDDFELPGTQSKTGQDLLGVNAPALGGFAGQVVMSDPNGPLSAVQGQINQAVAALGKLDHVVSAQSPLPASAGQPAPALSADGKIGYITVRFNQNPTSFDQSYIGEVDTAVAPVRAAGVQVEYGGALGELARPKATDLKSEAIGFAVAIVVLLIGFGSVLAAGLPLVTALISVIVGLSCLALLARAFTFGTVSPTLATMIGLGVGIDYALFLTTRHRQQLMDGVDPVRAAGRANTTSGRAVLVSGCTVIVALAGLYVSRVLFIGKLGAAAAVTVATAVVGALTLVPALLGLVGRRIDRLHVRKPIAEETAGESGALYRYAQSVARRPWWFLAAGVIVIGVLAIPLFSLRLGHIDDGADPTSFTDRRAYDLITTGFGPGANGPLTVVVDQANVPQDNRAALATNLQKALTGVPGAASISPPQATGSNGVLLTSTAVSTARPQDKQTQQLFDHLRKDVLPQAVAGTGATTYVTGSTAAQLDFVELMARRLPVIIAVVVGLAFLIILAVFRGLLVAVKAAVLNLLSISASYGVLVAVFQWGWGGPGLGVAGTVPIESYAPMIMFAIVFGLSMDYEVFLLSRVHEFWLTTGQGHESVAHGLRITARVITCAALIMVSVFSAFILSHDIVVKMLGLGLAVSVLIDATVVRLLLVPAVMVLFDHRAWWTPRWLDRLLPHIDAEGAAQAD
ncbi:MMPL family transporter [Kitasatospora viridis]|uniref:RND superfamily putative drug exporter n=1 Tax=Kitasatospora viridis TaxID=281105 RepID=A0A561S950_9ACTN|nr:MMPL family transporter [Kitasatospora viridis]TWF71396.1 RND superfamily putative drug exporter [Kitasatospora viridis]